MYYDGYYEGEVQHGRTASLRMFDLGCDLKNNKNENISSEGSSILKVLEMRKNLVQKEQKEGQCSWSVGSMKIEDG